MVHRSSPWLVAALAVAALGAGPAPAEARTAPPALTAVRCVPADAQRCARGVRVAIGQQIQLRGRRIKARTRVTFRWSRGALATRLQRTRAGLVARVPPGTAPGRVYVTVRDGAKRRSNRLRITVVAPRLRRPASSGGLPVAFGGNGMWIWQLPRAEGGDVAAIVQRARAARISTLFIKSSDGPSNRWAQFDAELVAQLHSAGLYACAWQFVYGSDPVAEARLGIDAVRAGADCLVVDAESGYKRRYASAQRYLAELRAGVGPDYPLGFTSFPYVDYHPTVPYSVFLGPGGAQVNVPQVYWKDIGDTVDAASGHTFAHNRIYLRPIAPLGQTYQSPAASDLRRFRQLWAGYGARGLSWWSWQHTPASLWAVLGEPPPPARQEPDPGWPVLERGDKGDQVVQLQQHLAGADPSVAVTGTFDAATDRALRNFQIARALPATGTTDAGTWQAVLAVAPRPRDWTQTAG